jgi:hypothetical protein
LQVLKKSIILKFFEKNKLGQLGTGNFENLKEVKLIRNDKTIKSICVGSGHSIIYHRKKNFGK